MYSHRGSLVGLCRSLLFVSKDKSDKLVILHVFLCIAIKTSANPPPPPPLSIMLTTSFCVHLIKQRDDTRHLKLGFSVHAIFLTTFPICPTISDVI